MRRCHALDAANQLQPFDLICGRMHLICERMHKLLAPESNARANLVASCSKQAAEACH